MNHVARRPLYAEYAWALDLLVDRDVFEVQWLVASVKSIAHS